MRLTVPSRPSGRQRREILDIFERTFSQEPSFQYMFPDRFRRARTRWVGANKLKLFADEYESVLAERLAVRGFAFWMRPDACADVGAQLRAGFWAAPLVAGPKGLLRMLEFSDQENEILQRYAVEPGRWILDIIAIHPDEQGRGIGSRLLEHVVGTCRERSVECFVVTHNRRNVGFYEKNGFRLVVSESMGKTDVTTYGLVA